MSELEKIDGLTTRKKVLALEAEMKKAPQLELPVEHLFSSQGVYARTLFIPKGVMLTGKIHKFAQINILLKGDIEVLVDGEVRRLRAPFMFVAPPGTKRIALAHEDTLWTTVHATTETDPDEIERQFVVETEQEFLAFCEEQKRLAKGETQCLS